MQQARLFLFHGAGVDAKIVVVAGRRKWLANSGAHAAHPPSVHCKCRPHGAAAAAGWHARRTGPLAPGVGGDRAAGWSGARLGINPPGSRCLSHG
jgi:hypothetical protein